jgi:hypothetical protein
MGQQQRQQHGGLELLQPLLQRVLLTQGIQS